MAHITRAQKLMLKPIALQSKETGLIRDATQGRSEAAFGGIAANAPEQPNGSSEKAPVTVVRSPATGSVIFPPCFFLGDSMDQNQIYVTSEGLLSAFSGVAT